MTNLDKLNEQQMVILNQFADSIKADDKEGFKTAFNALADNIGEQVKADFEAYRADADASILAQRGIRQLTSKERTFYDGVIGAMKSGDPKAALTNIDATFPETVIDAVFDDLIKAHPLLAKINFQKTGILAKIIVSTTGGVASWQELGSEVVDELTAEFIELDLTLAQVTAFVPVKRYMLDMGAEWLDRYVRQMLSEAIGAEIEAGVVNGTGKNEPIGMMRALTGAQDGVYPEKAVTATITALDASAFGTILDKLSTTRNDNRRAVTDLVMLVNPADYYTKVFPATTIRSTTGTFNNDTLPYPCEVIPVAGVTAGKAVFGLPSKYFMAMGTAGRGGIIEQSDHYHFLKLERVYMTYFYGNGRALDENDFVVVDISGLKPASLLVKVEETTA